MLLAGMGRSGATNRAPAEPTPSLRGGVVLRVYLEDTLMIVIRLFDVLDGICSQLSVHVFCCGSGTCPEPDGVRYETHPHRAENVQEVVPELVGMVHTQLSAIGGEGVSEIVQNHLKTHLAY
jgi:hypothetical protein